MQNGAAERQPLLPAAGERRHQRLLATAEPGHVDGEPHALGKLVARHAVDAAEEAQVFLDGEIAIERKFLRHVADVLAHPLRVAHHIDAGDENAPRARPQQAAEDADDGRFAGAVRAEKAHDLAVADAEADIIDGDEIAEALDQMLDADLRAGLAVAVHCVGHCRFPSSSSSATNTSSMVGATTVMSSNGTFCVCKAARSCGMRKSA